MGGNHQAILVRLLEINQKMDPEELFPTLAAGASELIHENDYAFCVAACLDRGTKSDIIWTIPYWLYRQVGHLKVRSFYNMSLETLTQLVE
ncbi:MAG: hypothetical protein CVU39_00010 [Chloroflexi bacterium HGW-Chloroflexi-10]|nr:MAG: hypothetical protein CVU39_00010 [Chloroflexi bacterium HGW-Chloroflexi-10]